LNLQALKFYFCAFCAFACPVKYRQIERSEFNRGGYVKIELNGFLDTNGEMSEHF
jgi:hypothetical protein